MSRLARKLERLARVPERIMLGDGFEAPLVVVSRDHVFERSTVHEPDEPAVADAWLIEPRQLYRTTFLLEGRHPRSRRHARVAFPEGIPSDERLLQLLYDLAIATGCYEWVPG